MTVNLNFVLNVISQSYYTFLAFFPSLKSVLRLTSSQTNPFLPILSQLMIYFPQGWENWRNRKNGKKVCRLPALHISTLCHLHLLLTCYYRPNYGFTWCQYQVSSVLNYSNTLVQLSSLSPTSFISHVYRIIFMNIQSYLSSWKIYICIYI